MMFIFNILCPKRLATVPSIASNPIDIPYNNDARNLFDDATQNAAINDNIRPYPIIFGTNQYGALHIFYFNKSTQL